MDNSSIPSFKLPQDNSDLEGSIPSVHDDMPSSYTSVPASTSLDMASISHVPTTINLPADDVDLIEKPWVKQAKRILAHFSPDPKLQANEFSKLRTQYLEKRFGKVIKSAEDGVDSR